MSANSSHRFPWRWNLSDLAAPDDSAPTVLSMFSCGGGSSMGYKPFPQDYDFLDSRVSPICGMSVPPVMMANISHEVRRQWLVE
jgi:DNA (cytosine-5)-methyltransferase 1